MRGLIELIFFIVRGLISEWTITDKRPGESFDHSCEQKIYDDPAKTMDLNLNKRKNGH